MSDATAGGTPDQAAATGTIDTDARTKSRKAAETRFQLYGVIAIGIGLTFLVTLLASILMNGLTAFQQTTLRTNITLNADEIAAAEASFVKTARYRDIILGQLEQTIQAAGVESYSGEKNDLRQMMSAGAPATLREFVLANPSAIGTTQTFEFNTSSRVDGYLKGRVSRASLARDRNLDPRTLDLVDALEAKGIIEKSFNIDFITGADASDSRPEQAGIGVSMLGSFFMMLVVLGLSLPIGVAASIYLEEFAPKNWFTDLIEVNISNLAAVPSIVFGILGLAVFIQFMHLPQSAPLVGGLVLTLMTLPTIIISTRASLKAVPPSIRDAALGVGASKMQTVFHHVLPLALPGILTGTIIGLAQALGETAPLLLIGMVGFIASNYPEGIASGFLDPNSAMPAQIFEWAKRADPAFYERAWGGIIILLGFLMTMNTIAILLRRKFERRW
ncbi:MAG: phosphate ABC transporter permease PstA [Pseudomonadota bacterium]